MTTTTSQELLYKIVEKYGDEFTDEPGPYPAKEADPAGWMEYCQEKWGEYRPFFWPSTKRIYRSRSAAVERAALVNRWGGNVTVVECTPVWVTVGEASRKRREWRQLRRLQGLREAVAKAEHKLALVREEGNR